MVWTYCLHHWIQMDRMLSFWCCYLIGFLLRQVAVIGDRPLVCWFLVCRRQDLGFILWWCHPKLRFRFIQWVDHPFLSWFARILVLPWNRKELKLDTRSRWRPQGFDHRFRDAPVRSDSIGALPEVWSIGGHQVNQPHLWSKWLFPALSWVLCSESS